MIDHAPRCWRCDRKLADYLTRPWSRKCKRCKAPNVRRLDSSEPEGDAAPGPLESEAAGKVR